MNASSFILTATTLITVIGLCIAEPAHTPADATVITADTLDFDYRRQQCVFSGNVVVTEPRLKLECENLHVFFSDGNQVETVVATDRVRITQGDRTATCEKAVYTAASGTIVMTGNPQLSRGRDRVIGGRDGQDGEIRFFVHSDRVIASPSSLTVIPPPPTAGDPGASPFPIRAGNKK